MILPLPLDQFRFNLVLRILITIYGISGIGDFFACVPGWSKEDAKILGCNYNSNYLFQLISSLIFLLLGIYLFRYPLFVRLSAFEVYFLIVVYFLITVKKWRFFRKNKSKSKKINKTNDKFY